MQHLLSGASTAVQFGEFEKTEKFVMAMSHLVKETFLDKGEERVGN